ncbi:MAG: tetratricopeptide repeat protein [Rikenellaceae bacterium]
MRSTLLIASVIALASCSVTSRLHRHESTAQLSQLTKVEREMQAEQQSPMILTSEREGKRFFVAPTETIDGEQVMSLQMEQVTVVSKLRTIPERGGEITLDFVVSIPKELLGSSRNVTIIPELHNDEGVKALEPLTIRGALVDKIQRRDYWQYETYVSRYSPTEEVAERMYNRFVKFPRPEDSRLDSLIENRSHITYYYSQSLRTDEQTKRLKITLNGRVEGVDNTIYNMPPSDTLTYTISSMLSFLDTAPRFRVKIVDKYVVVNDRSYIRYPLGRCEIVDTLGENSAELAKIRKLMREITEQDEFFVDTITLTATSSPEGSHTLNSRLSERRAVALKNYLGREVEQMITVKWIAEDWVRLRELIAAEESLAHRSQILKIIDSESDPDRREVKIWSSYPLDYAIIKRELYPQLRAVDFKYNLRRKGMVKDTIQTTELDTTYARGVKLLQQRNYPQALYILNEYRDRNTIIAHLSMAHDGEALRLLDEQPANATTHYLRAIALARLGRTAEAIEAFDEACELEPKMKFRANLDPEITKLLER